MTLPSRTIRVAVVQACTVAYDLTLTLEKLELFAEEAKSRGVELACFPEAL